MLLYFSPGFLLLAVPVAVYTGIRGAYRRRRFRRLIETRNLLFDRGDDGWKLVQQELNQWIQSLHPRAAKELQDWYRQTTS